MPSNKSDTQASTQSTVISSEWPSLPTVPDTQSIYAGIEEKWIQQPCPLELEHPPFPVPAIVSQFLRESTQKETYLRPERSDGVSDGPPKGNSVAVSRESPSGKRDAVDEKALSSSNDGDGDAGEVGKNSTAKTGGKKRWNPFEPKKESVYSIDIYLERV